MNKLFIKIFALVFIILLIIILLLPNKNQLSKDIKVLSFEIYEDKQFQVGQNITLLVILENAQNIGVETLIINGNQTNAEDFTSSSSNGRIIFNYLLTESDFKDNNLFLTLQGIYLNNTKIKTNNIIYRKVN